MEPTEIKKREIGEDIKDLESYLRENFHSIFGIINAVRHGHSFYTEKYPDLTPEGRQVIESAAEKIVEETDGLSRLAINEGAEGFKQDILFVSSPQARARASAEIIKAQFGQSAESNVRTKKSMRAMDIHDFPQALRLLVGLAGGRWTPRTADYLHANKPEYEDRTDLWESRSQVRNRFMQALNSACGTLARYQEKFHATPRVIITSHFEGLNPLLMEVFNLSQREEDDELLKRGESYAIYLLRSDDPNRIPMIVDFRGKTKEVIFNRQTKSFL